MAQSPTMLVTSKLQIRTTMQFDILLSALLYRRVGPDTTVSPGMSDALPMLEDNPHQRHSHYVVH